MRKRERHREGGTERDIEKEVQRETYRRRYRERHREGGTERDIEKEVQRETQRRRYRERHREGGTERDRDTEGEREMCIQIENQRQIVGVTDIQTERYIDVRLTDRETPRQKYTEIKRQRDIKQERQINKEFERQGGKETERQINKETIDKKENGFIYRHQTNIQRQRDKEARSHISRKRIQWSVLSDAVKNAKSAVILKKISGIKKERFCANNSLKGFRLHSLNSQCGTTERKTVRQRRKVTDRE